MTSDSTTWGRVNQRRNLREFEVNRSEKGCGAVVISVINLLLDKGQPEIFPEITSEKVCCSLFLIKIYYL
jgi:hypothetical protein